MRPGRRRATPAALAALVCAVTLPLVACGPGGITTIPEHQIPEHVKVLRIQIPSFDASRIEGIWLWRLSAETGEYEPEIEIRLSGVVVEDGREYVEYAQYDPDGNPLGFTPSAELARAGSEATLALWLVRFGPPGDFKASLYNAAGESGLSSQTLPL